MAFSGATPRLLRTCAVAVTCAGAAAAQPLAPPDSISPPAGSHRFCVRDLWALERVSDPQPSPDGTTIVYVRRGFDVRANKGHSSLWLVRSTGGDPRRITSGQANDTSPRWSADGRRIAFLSDRGGSTQIWTVDPGGGEPRRSTDLPVDVETFKWSPAGDAFAFSAEVYPDCPTLDCTKERTKKLEGDGVLARRYDHLLFRHWDTWDSGRRQHLFVVPATGGTPIDLVRQGGDLEAPPTPFGGAEAYDWAPDGKSIVFEGRARGSSASWTTDTDLYLAAVDGANLDCITEPNLAADGNPVFSPDGRTIAYLATVRAGYESDRERIVVYDVHKRARRVLTEAWDRSPAELVWSPAGGTLYVTVPEQARRQLYAVDAGSGQPKKIAHSGSATSLRPCRATGHECIVFLGESLTAPAEVWACEASGKSAPIRLTDSNPGVVADARMSVPETLWCKGHGGARVHAWLFPPVDHKDGERVPLVVLVHGGPQGSWDDRFSYRWNPQVFAGAGYAVLAPDPRGSVGYGQAFTDDINGDWGGKAYEDLMKSIDHALATVTWLDSTRIAAAGASYGGYMVDWIAGHTDRFRCLVSHAGLFDLPSFWGATEEQWFPEWEFEGTPWENESMYARWSPSAAVQNWKTPMLVTFGGRDYRVPESQGLATFTALQRKGIPSEMIYFPTENHWILKPQTSILWHDAVLAWLDRWLRGGAAASGTR